MSTGPRLEVTGVRGLPEFERGGDLVRVLAPALRDLASADDDVVVVTSKIVSKAEGRLVPGTDRSEAVASETRRVVARRGDLVIAETRHGFVCANAGVDASNLEPGTIALLPLDPDASAERLRAGLSQALGVRLAVLITDTFGRAWRTGVVNVAVGCAGLPAAVDLRGRPDDRGRALEATIVALADEIAAASGLVMAKDAGVPVALVRGVDRLGGEAGRAADLVRPASEDLFRVNALEAIRSSTGPVVPGPDPVPPELVTEAIAACAPAWPPGGPARRFTVIDDPTVIGEVVASSPDPLPALLVIPWLRVAEDPAEPGWWFAAGAAANACAIALNAAGLVVRWIEQGMDVIDEPGGAGWVATGALACGYPA